MRAALIVALAGLTAGWSPARDAAGDPLTWPTAAWPLPLADGPLAWARAAATWTAATDVGFLPVPAAPPGVDGVENYGLYLRDTQPVIKNARYRYLLVRFTPNGEVAQIIPTNEVTIPAP